MWKEACTEFAKIHEVETIHIESKEENSRTNRVDHLRWYFYKEIEGVRVPAFLYFRISFYHYNSKKEVNVRGNYPYPTPDIIELSSEFIEFMKPKIKEFLNSMDTDRLRKITEGINYQGDKIKYEGDVIETVENFKKIDVSLEKEDLDSIYKNFAAYQLQFEQNAKGADEEKFLIVHGEKGRQVAERLENKLLGKTKEIKKDMYLIELLFPFVQGAKEKKLSGQLLYLGTPFFLTDKGVVSFTIGASDLENYLKKS